MPVAPNLNGEEFYAALRDDILCGAEELDGEDGRRREYVSIGIDIFCMVQALTLAAMAKQADFSADGFWAWLQDHHSGLPTWFPTERIIECQVKTQL